MTGWRRWRRVGLGMARSARRVGLVASALAGLARVCRPIGLAPVGSPAMTAIGVVALARVWRRAGPWASLRSASARRPRAHQAALAASGRQPRQTLAPKSRVRAEGDPPPCAIASRPSPPPPSRRADRRPPTPPSAGEGERGRRPRKTEGRRRPRNPHKPCSAQIIPLSDFFHLTEYLVTANHPVSPRLLAFAAICPCRANQPPAATRSGNASRSPRG